MKRVKKPQKRTLKNSASTESLNGNVIDVNKTPKRRKVDAQECVQVDELTLKVRRSARKSSGGEKSSGSRNVRYPTYQTTEKHLEKMATPLVKREYVISYLPLLYDFFSFQLFPSCF